MNKTSRRSFYMKISAIMAGMGLVHFRSAANNTVSNVSPGPFYHIVFFWLKDPQNKESREKFLGHLNSFVDHVDMIRTKHIGTPAATDRPVIDNTWTYSLVLSFDSKDEHDVYQDHGLHKKFIADAGELWERVQVYDSTL